MRRVLRDVGAGVVGLFLGVGVALVYSEHTLGEPTVAIGTLALAFATAWLALEARAERTDLREQYERSVRATREQEIRRWGIELRRIVLQIEDATLEYEQRAQQAASAFEGTNDGAYATARVEARRPWVEVLHQTQLDLQDRLDLVDLLDPAHRVTFILEVSDAVDATEKARTSKEVQRALDVFLNSVADVVDALTLKLGLASIRQVRRREVSG